MTIHTITVRVTSAEFPTITIDDTFDVKIGYPCATATLTIPVTPFTDGSIYINEASKTIVSTWLADSDLVTINSQLDCGAY